MARIRVQLSAAHSRENLESCVSAFVKVRDELRDKSVASGVS
jgi:hypothetical protein